MSSRESELWDSIAAALIDENHEALDQLIKDVPFGTVLVNLVGGSLNNRIAFGEIFNGTLDQQIGATSFQGTGGNQDGS